MARQKLKRIVDSEEKANIIQPGKAEYGQLRNKWAEEFFKNTLPITLELGCGKGEYSVALAKLNPDRNYLGVDIKGPRLWVGAQQAMDEGLSNVGFVRSYIQNIDRHVGAGEVDEIWIPFPDPRPRVSDARRRLTSPRFLAMYRNMLAPLGVLRLKTDNEDLFDYSIDSIAKHGFTIRKHTKDLYASTYLPEHHGIQTYFEKIFLGQGIKINYLEATLDPTPNPTT